jgi:hypothetical protein
LAGGELVAIRDEISRVRRELVAFRVEHECHVQRRSDVVARRHGRERHAENDDTVDERGEEERRPDAFIAHARG